MFNRTRTQLFLTQLEFAYTYYFKVSERKRTLKNVGLFITAVLRIVKAGV